MGACDNELTALYERLLQKYHLPTRAPASIGVNEVLAEATTDLRKG